MLGTTRRLALSDIKELAVYLETLPSKDLFAALKPLVKEQKPLILSYISDDKEAFLRILYSLNVTDAFILSTLLEYKEYNTVLRWSRVSANIPYKVSEVFYSTNSDVVTYLLKCVASEGTGICSVIVDGAVDYYYLLSNAIVPHKLYSDRKIRILLSNLANGTPSDVIKYWTGIDAEELSRVRLWSMMTSEYARENVGPEYLYFTHPYLLYTSKRLKTDMHMFRNPFSETYVNKPQLTILSDGEYEISECVLPVTRYSKSVEEGLYHGDPTGEEYCGTFYYYELESRTLLIGGKTLVAETKCRAAQYLLSIANNTRLAAMVNKYLDSEPLYDVLNKYLGSENIAWNNGDYRQGLMYTPHQAFYELGIGKQDKLDTVSDVAIYVGYNMLIDRRYNIGLYASEDVFDQELCLFAAELGYDIVVLTRMVGSYQVVTEVLDTRERSVSIYSLIYPDE